MTNDGDIHISVLLQHLSKLSQRSLRCSIQISLVCSEQDTRIESNLYSLQTVSVSDSLHLSVLNSLGLFLSLIHLLTDDGTCCSTYSTTDNSSDSSVTSHLTDDSAYYSATASTYCSTLSSVTYVTSYQNKCSTQSCSN